MVDTPFSALYPELFSLIASHLPLHSAPPTLLALALTNHTYHNVARPLLFSRIILRNERDALNFTELLVAQPSLGNLVQELHVKSQMSVQTHNSNTCFDIVTGLMKVIEANILYNVHTLGFNLHTQPWWLDDAHSNSTIRYGQLPKDFWRILHSNCPRLKSIMLSGVGDSKEDRWLDRAEIFDLDGAENLTGFGLTFQRRARAKMDGPNKLLKNLHLLSSGLHTLVLGVSYVDPDSFPILTLRFPRLRSLTLENFDHDVKGDTLCKSMAFWRAHPLLQYLRLPYPPLGSCWFKKSLVDDEILPNLKHLQATFCDVYALAPILHRLTSLSIHSSINAQIPYLLRSVIPTGLPLLKGLEIRQQARWDDTWISLPEGKEGALWYETEDGTFHEPDPVKTGNPKKIKAEVKRFFRSLVDKYYMHSIVRGAPNLEEISLHTGIGIHPHIVLDSLGPYLAKFKHLERIYYPAISPNDVNGEKTRALFHGVAEKLAKKCKMLNVVTDIKSPTMPYVAARIRRTDGGDVKEVILVEGYGMLIGNEDTPFPKYYGDDVYYDEEVHDPESDPMAGTPFATSYPELFLLIASHLPIRSAPSTLLALSLTNHTYYNVTRPLLFSRVILRNERGASNFTELLADNPSLGNLVQELHIKSQPSSVQPADKDICFDIVTGVLKIIEANVLPNIHTLGLHLHTKAWWSEDADSNLTIHSSQLPKDFWKTLRSNCARLKNVVISGVNVIKEDRAEFFNLDGADNFTSFGLTAQRWAHAEKDGPIKSLLRKPRLIAYTDSSVPPTPIAHSGKLRKQFQRGLSIAEHDFLARSSLIAVSELAISPFFARWFDKSDVDEEILPNLEHLQATFRDVYALAPILHRLTSLSIHRSINAQIPYLLRDVIPTGLPRLKSLGIRQQPRWDRSWISRPDGVEGALWYESEDGVFHTPDPGKIENPKKIKAELKRFFRPLDDKYYMHSIVKGAPNLEEISLHVGDGLHPLLFLDSVGPHVAKFEHLERIYYAAITHKDKNDEKARALFHEVAEKLAKECKRLNVVTDIKSPTMPYVAARIRRTDGGDVKEVIPVEGYGMLIGNEDTPFPKYYGDDVY
ncbi:hypothetical protein CPB84DRAFT_1848174 [Gymnopilus junonius]|uniref:F-box domain-containing protein n=1 Tax=Gymnopilus junonius TaxID=109634 RepID=A0A9P5NLH9_GYMJU|nr:hypothetical protein CPB84DRAFT_1848174 [Gymnopilus junonius]